ncbi:MAG: endonuclease/exonuclease/phosphatase family protein [Deltaproteobacteria bacterium]|nr:endonuclease/exonuclease/phosphatase family protein [Deltaproteobacteria bacterium]
MKVILILIILILALIALAILWAKSPLNPKRPILSQQIKEFSFPTQTNKKNSSLTLVTYNLGYASGTKNNQGSLLSQTEVNKKLQKAAQALITIRPDIVFLQEVDFNASRSHYQDQAKFLAKALGLNYSAEAITWNLNYLPWPSWKPSLHFGPILSGQVILSRFPLKNPKLINMQKPPNNPFWYNWFYLERVVQKVNLEIKGEDFSLYNAHLEAFDSQHRQQQIEHLKKELQKDQSKNLIIAGDFNQNDRHLSLIENKDFAISFPSFPSWEPKEFLDQIHGRSSKKLLNQGTIKQIETSDHLAVWIKLKL